MVKFFKAFSYSPSSFLNQILSNSSCSPELKEFFIKLNSSYNSLNRDLILNKASFQEVFLIPFKEIKTTGYCPYSEK